MRTSTVMTGALLATFACRRAEVTSVDTSAQTSALIERLVWSCQPDDVAQLLVIASSSPDRELRCRAMSELYGHPLIDGLNRVWEHTGVVVLERPDNQQAIRLMLGDPQPWCFHPREHILPHDTAGNISPRQTAALVLADFPIPAFEPELEHALAEEKAAGRTQPARAIERALDSIDFAVHEPPSRRAAVIDEIVEGGTPDKFEQLVDFLAEGYEWNGSASPTPEEVEQVRAHMGSAFQWLFYMVVLLEASPPKPEWGRTPSHELWDAVARGELGRKLVASFDRLEPSVRGDVLDLLELTKPVGYLEWMRGVARDDPDPTVRNEARRLLSRSERP
jgi:hypothetical protein